MSLQDACIWALLIAALIGFALIANDSNNYRR